MQPDENNPEKQPHRPIPIITITLFVVNLAVFVIGLFFGLDWLDPSPEALLRLGGNCAAWTLLGESYRLVTNIFLHGGIWHLVVNMIMLLVIGSLAERGFGRIPFALIYIASGVWGSLASAYWFSHREAQGVKMVAGMLIPTKHMVFAVSVGASGALMGAIAACLGARAVENLWGDLPPQRFVGTGKALGQILAINLILGLFIPGVDKAAHFGGGLAGFLLGLIIFGLGYTHALRRFLVSLLATALATFLAFQLAHREPSEKLKEFRQLLDAQAQETAEINARKNRVDLVARQAAEDAAKTLAPVSEAEAAGTLIDLKQSGASALAIGSSGKRLYAAFEDSNALIVVDLESKQPLRVIQGKNPYANLTGGCKGSLHTMCREFGASDIAISKDERFAYVTSFTQNSLDIISLENGQVVKSIPAGNYPGRIMLSADEKLAFVIHRRENAYSVIDLVAQNALSPPVKLYGGDWNSDTKLVSLWMSQQGRIANIYDPGNNEVISFDSQTRQVESKPATGMVNSDIKLPLSDDRWLLFGPRGIAIYQVKRQKSQLEFTICENEVTSNVQTLSPDKSLLALGEYRQNSVRLIKLATGKTVGVFPIENGAGAITFSADGKRIFALDRGGKLAIFDPTKSMAIKEDDLLYCVPKENR